MNMTVNRLKSSAGTVEGLTAGEQVSATGYGSNGAYTFIIGRTATGRWYFVYAGPNGTYTADYETFAELDYWEGIYDR